jgi:hypothetical protein
MIPNAEDWLALEPEELAGVLLEHLNSLDERSPSLNRYNFGVPGVSPADAYPTEYRESVNRGLVEAWGSLEREVLIASRPGDTANWVFVTRRGKALAHRQGLNSYRHAALLPKDLLHPVISQNALNRDTSNNDLLSGASSTFACGGDIISAGVPTRESKVDGL